MVFSEANDFRKDVYHCNIIEPQSYVSYHHITVRRFDLIQVELPKAV